MRLDFNTFVITGPSTETTASFDTLGGNPVQTGKGVGATLATTCATDVLSITNAPNLPTLCGTLTGDHGNPFKLFFTKTYVLHTASLARNTFSCAVCILVLKAKETKKRHLKLQHK
jgi:hypothetical protein